MDSIKLYFALFAIFLQTICTNAILFPIEARLPLKGIHPSPDSLWPLPQSWKRSNELFTIDPKSFSFDSNMNICDVMSGAMKRYKDIIFIDHTGVKAQNLPVLISVYIEVEQYHECGYPRHEEDEQYTINITSGSSVGKISAKSVWGGLRALETFSQLVHQNELTKEFLVNVTQIDDYPRYKYRALLLDSARHFQPKKVILANLDAMAYNKFNVFHWHIVDDQSFPFESKQFPELTKSAYSPKHVYTQKDVSDIIEYARMRGIRVIPEVDTPGHTQAIGRAFPELLTPCYGEGDNKPYTPKYPEFSAAEMLNPMRNRTYTFMKDLYREFKGVFKDDYIHLGMDEVYYGCWNSSPEVRKFIKDHGMEGTHEFEEYYVTHTLTNVKDIGYKYVMWQDPADNGVTLSSDSIVVVWKDKYLDSSMDYWQNYISKLSKLGHQMVLAACWYLNYIETPYPGRDWEKFYTCDPRNFTGSEQEKDLVIGGEVCMWGEFVDGTNVLSRLWPRASSVAERLWSNSNDTQDVNTARLRLDRQRCRMLRRGIPAAPILNGYCGDYEWQMNDNEQIKDFADRVRL